MILHLQSHSIHCVRLSRRIIIPGTVCNLVKLGGTFVFVFKAKFKKIWISLSSKNSFHHRFLAVVRLKLGCKFQRASTVCATLLGSALSFFQYKISTRKWKKIKSYAWLDQTETIPFYIKVFISWLLPRSMLK